MDGHHPTNAGAAAAAAGTSTAATTSTSTGSAALGGAASASIRRRDLLAAAGHHQQARTMLSSSPPTAAVGGALGGGAGRATLPGAPSAAAAAARRGMSPARIPRAMPARLATAASKQAPAPRPKEKFVALPEEGEDESDADGDATAGATPSDTPRAAEAAAAADAAARRQFHEENASFSALESPFAGGVDGASAQHLLPLQPPPPPSAPPLFTGRIGAYCVADAFDRPKLESLLRGSFPASAISAFPDAFVVELDVPRGCNPGQHALFFDYGVVVCWGLERVQEARIVRTLARDAAGDGWLDDDAAEVDEFGFAAVPALERARIANDVITLHRRALRDVRLKLSISYALAQSTKLSAHEKAAAALVAATHFLPTALAETGEAGVSDVDVARFMGEVFIAKSAVNLLGDTLGNPDFFWHERDALLALYGRVCEYLELDDRVDVLNARFAVLHEMLEMLRDHSHQHHATRLEWIVIILIFVELLVGLITLADLIGAFGRAEAAGGGGGRRR